MISINVSRNNAILFIKLFIKLFTQLNYLSPLVMPPTVCSYIFFFLIFHPFFLPSYLLASDIWERIQFTHSVTSNSMTSWTAARHAALSITKSQSLLKLPWWFRR